MQKINSIILLTITFGFLIGCGGGDSTTSSTNTNLSVYTDKDWEVYNACKERVYTSA